MDIESVSTAGVLAAQGTKSTQTKLKYSGLLDSMPGSGAPEGESAN